MSITRTFEISDITPQELAAVFCKMWAEEQAAFFTAIRPIAATWPGAGLCQQSYAINQALDTDGRFVLETLASHLPNEVLARLAVAA